MTKRNQTGVLYIRDLPDGLKDEFKASCAAAGVTMTAAIEEFMKRVVEMTPTKARRVLREVRRSVSQT